MKAFVKTNNGTFPNLNFYLAWEAFNTLGYSVTCFEEKDIESLEVTPATPVFAGVKIFRQIVVDKLKTNYPPFDCYPTFTDFAGQSFYGRNIRRSTLGEERAKFHKDGVPVFVKPVLPKQFLGHVWNSIINLIPIANVPDDAEVWVSEPMEIFSEFRAYVNDGEILGVKHYYGDWSIIPNKMVVEEVVERYIDCPIAYGIDFAVVANGSHYKTIVMEVNDGCNLGNYGLDSIHYGEMIVARWFEIMADSNISTFIAKEIQEEKERGFTPTTFKFRDGTDYTTIPKEELYLKPYESGSLNYKQLMVKEDVRKRREQSMAAFAKEVQQRLKEGEV